MPHARRPDAAPIGFLRAEDKRFFQLFITVKGIGPKQALRALVQPAGQIAEAIESKNTKFLIGLPEIGKHTAEQIVAELAGKMHGFALDHADGGARRIASLSQWNKMPWMRSGPWPIPRPDTEDAARNAPARSTPSRQAPRHCSAKCCD